MATVQKGKDRTLFGGGGRNGQPKRDEFARPNPDKEIAAEVETLEKDLNELRSVYELYFMGIEKQEPLTTRDLLKSQIRRWQELKPRNTALRFKIQQLKARMVSLENYWQRTLRQREAGTYKRDLARVKRREGELQAQEMAAEKLRAVQRGEAPASDVARTQDGRMVPPSGRDITGAALRAGRSAAHTAGGSAAPGEASTDHARPRATSAADLTEPKLRKLYQTYIGARKRCGEAVDLRYEDMAAALRKQVPKLLGETGAGSVEFKVVIRKGHAVLKALPKD